MPDIHQRAYEAQQSGKKLQGLERVAAAQLDQQASQQAGQAVTNANYKGGANAQYKKIGKAVGSAAPLAALIPGVGPLAAGAIGFGGSMLGGKSIGQSLLAGGGSALGSHLMGGQGFQGLGGAMDTLGLKTAEGKPDITKLLGIAMAGANVVGANQQRKSAENYNNANIDLRNQLLSRVLSGGIQQ